jgi:histidine triad (HIT) family protein
MTNDCLFCGIVHHEVDAYKIYEDDDFIAILDRFPKCLGHTLIIPKRHAASLFDLPEETAAKVLPLAKKLAEKMLPVIKFTGLNLLQNNGEDAQQTVKHFHLHLIPRFSEDAMMLQWKTEDPSPEEFEAMAEKLKM